ncbi:M23 family metallopeptidase [Leucobacter denitrificans]|uniref:M23 family metallopeptidase n=1 Tax=Leucobacter denitrificans TaxID=683042 RepID=A0A7G9S5Y4_9MICO|nr:M23 family metallopeptidase [Leucobacter denitrificans]QNN63259.1 M23 family metallopeptidase [Leucobacter denitrificans]
MKHSLSEEYLTPRPDYTPGTPDAERTPTQWFKKPFISASAVACIGLLAVSTTLPAISIADVGGTPASAAEQHLLSADAVGGAGVLDAIGTTDVGLDLSGLTALSTEAGLLDPAMLEPTEFRLPFDKDWPLTDGFAYRTAPVEQFHDAQDFAAADGTPVKSIGSGVVIEAGYATDGCGFSLKVQHLIANGSTLTSRYCHMQSDSHSYAIGDEIVIGDEVGRVGNTGLSFGSHLHLALKLNGTPIDPLPYLHERIAKQES